MIKQNKVSKYFFYAIGEIVLVVIGILIALQINNANDAKKEKKELYEYLSKISNNIKLDVTNLKDIKSRRLKVVEDCKLAIQSFHANAFDLKTNLKAGQVFVDFYFAPNQSGYEALKNSSYLGKINGTRVDSLLDNYHVILNKVLNEESSYITYVENMEVLWTSNFDMSELMKVYFQDTEKIRLQDLDADLQKKIIPMFKSEYFRSTVSRGSFQSNLLAYYDELIEAGNKVVEEINNIIDD